MSEKHCSGGSGLREARCQERKVKKELHFRVGEKSPVRNDSLGDGGEQGHQTLRPE
jgi:hypothetical protein